MTSPERPAAHDWVINTCEAKGLIQGSHHGRIDLRLNGKIVVNLEADDAITIKLPLDEQQVLLQAFPNDVHLPNGWGHHGWTTLHVDRLSRDLVNELIDMAIHTVANPR